MKTLIKICGLTTVSAVECIIENNVDMAGFVFAEQSPRYIKPKHAKQLADLIPNHISKVAVMLHPTQTEVDEVIDTFKPDYLQMDAKDFLNTRIPESIESLKVYRDEDHLDISSISNSKLTLFEGIKSGSGKLTNIKRSQKVAKKKRVIIAGGLNPNNILSVLSNVCPLGVDVSSGVESEPGLKSEQKIIQFIRIVREYDEKKKNE